MLNKLYNNTMIQTAKKTNEWVLNKAGVKRELLDTAKAMKLAYYGHTMRKQRSCLEKEIMQFLHCIISFSIQATPLFPHGVTIIC